MSDNIFVDTNILVYSRDSSEPEKQPVALEALKGIWQARTGRISTQVCSEYYVTVTGKLHPGLPPEQAWQALESLLAWEPIPIDFKILRKARECEMEYQLSWWDSLIISAAFYTDCKAILTEDLSDGQTYFGIAVENPFL